MLLTSNFCMHLKINNYVLVNNNKRFLGSKSALHRFSYHKTSVCAMHRLQTQTYVLKHNDLGANFLAMVDFVRSGVLLL